MNPVNDSFYQPYWRETENGDINIKKGHKSNKNIRKRIRFLSLTG